MSAVPSPISADRAKTENKSADSPGKYQNSLACLLTALVKRADGQNVDLGTIVSSLSGGSHAVLIVFLSFPLCLPVGIPVLSTTLGLALGFVGFLLAVGRDIRLPKTVSAKVVPYDRLTGVIQRLLRVSSRVDRWFHPRMSFFVLNGAVIRFHGVFVMLLAFIAAIPLPLPFNNLVAAFPVLLLGFSLLEKDGLLVIVSYVAAIPFFLYYGALIYLGNAGFQRLMGF